MVVKIGGSTLGQHDTTLSDLVELQKKGVSVIVVHGGGKIITEWLSKQGAATRFVNGERVTDKTGLEVVTAVLAGLVNKELVASLQAAGAAAVGLSGVDGGLLLGRVKNPELGYVGNPVQVNLALIKVLLDNGYLPVVSSISLNKEQPAAGESLLLNVNADAAAGEIAAVTGAHKLIFLTDIAGICDKNGAVIARLSVQQAAELIEAGTASGGMIPKIRAGLRALESARLVRIIDGRQPHALLNEINKAEGGTTITRD